MKKRCKICGNKISSLNKGNECFRHFYPYNTNLEKEKNKNKVSLCTSGLVGNDMVHTLLYEKGYSK